MPSAPGRDLTAVHAFCELRVPTELLAELRVEAEVEGTEVTLVERRVPWDGGAGAWTRSPVAQLRFDPKLELWALYWPDRNDRWHRYDGLEPTSVERVLREIADDPTCIFWG
jgi:hypothetical protein